MRDQGLERKCGTNAYNQVSSHAFRLIVLISQGYPLPPPPPSVEPPRRWADIKEKYEEVGHMPVWKQRSFLQLSCSAQAFAIIQRAYFEEREGNAVGTHHNKRKERSGNVRRQQGEKMLRLTTSFPFYFCHKFPTLPAYLVS